MFVLNSKKEVPFSVINRRFAKPFLQWERHHRVADSDQGSSFGLSLSWVCLLCVVFGCMGQGCFREADFALIGMRFTFHTFALKDSHFCLKTTSASMSCTSFNLSHRAARAHWAVLHLCMRCLSKSWRFPATSSVPMASLHKGRTQTTHARAGKKT